MPETHPVDPASLTPKEMVELVQKGGLVGLGGAAFPSHVKFQVPEGRQMQAAVINGCECEPYLTCDHRLMVERPEVVMRGAEIIRIQIGAERGYIGVEANKPDAVAALQAIAPPTVEVVSLKVTTRVVAELHTAEPMAPEPSSQLCPPLKVSTVLILAALRAGWLVDSLKVTVTVSSLSMPATTLVSSLATAVHTAGPAPSVEATAPVEARAFAARSVRLPAV